MFCRTTHLFCNQLINYLLTGYPVRTENTKPSVTSHGPHFVRSVLCDFGLSIFQYRPGNQLINSYYDMATDTDWLSRNLIASHTDHTLLYSQIKTSGLIG